MALLTDDQKMLQETAASFLAEEGSIAKQLRHWRDIGCTDGFGHGLWKQFAELGPHRHLHSRERRRAWASARSRRRSCWRRSAAT